MLKEMFCCTFLVVPHPVKGIGERVCDECGANYYVFDKDSVVESIEIGAAKGITVWAEEAGCPNCGE